MRSTATGMQRRRRQWSTAAAAMATLLVAAQLVQRSTQLRRSHPLHEAVDTINERGGPYVGLIMAFPLEEAALQASALFVPNSTYPSVQLAGFGVAASLGPQAGAAGRRGTTTGVRTESELGDDWNQREGWSRRVGDSWRPTSAALLSGRRFNIGTIRGVNVIYVMTGEQIINAGITTQILYDMFDVVGVVHYGIAGSTNNSLLIGDVAIPTHVAFTGSWDWQESGSSEGTMLKFGAYNVPTKGDNLLGYTVITPVQLYTSSSTMENLFWLPVDPNWFKIASQIKGATVLQRCINETDTQYCMPEVPKAAFGLRGSTADVYLNNAAYRGFLREKFNVSFADEESAAVVMTSLSNGKPSVVFRGISDYAGGSGANKVSVLSTSMASKLAATNALNLAVEFIELIGNYNGGVAA